MRVPTFALSLLISTLVTFPTQAQTVPALQITVNSPQDGPIAPDEALTLREAIALANGTLDRTNLSATEQQLVQPSQSTTIGFDLPLGQTTIELKSLLPAIAQPGVTLDGTTQPGYDPILSATAEIAIPIPIVTITTAKDVEIFRGLTLIADDITVRGVSLYGFTAEHRATETLPPADIFITHPDLEHLGEPAYGIASTEEAPQGIVIEHNWLGFAVDNQMPEQTSAFGVSVFNSVGTRIQQNRISYHDGSGVITGARAENLEVINNIIVNNGLRGIPDGIRLEGYVNNGLITENLLCGNDGGGIFLFKPQGAVEINNNDIRSNGQRYRRAAIYLMGNDHQVVNNSITNQKGPGVVVTAFSQGGTTQSQRNIIQDNRFESLEGLSIDLVTRHHVAVQDFQQGDGPNPLRNSRNRRLDTGNSAINPPQFISPEFFQIDGQAVIQGQADIGATVQLYLTRGGFGEYGPLTTPLTTMEVDEEGTFTYASGDLQPGDVITGIATDPEYGTSEPALNTIVLALGETHTTRTNRMEATTAAPVQCTTPPTSPTPPPPPETLRLEVPRNVHFGLDEDFINADSAVILDQIATVMDQYPSIIVDLHGHTDSRASVAYNQDLARRRAENARRYLIQQGIAPERMTLRSFGETELLVNETDRVNYARNRRVEFVFSDVRGLDITFVNQEDDLQIEQ